MNIDVTNATLKGAAQFAYPSQDDYVLRACPICGRSDESILVADVRCGAVTSLESAFCQPCEQWYLRKLPSPEWYGRYYAANWDTGRSQSTVSPGLVTQAKILLNRLSFVRSARALVRYHALNRSGRRSFTTFNPEVSGAATQVFPFLAGVVESSGFYQAQPDVNKVLEVGCGYGAVLEVFRRKGFTAVGTEASQTRAQSCRARGLNVFDCPTDNFDPIQHLAPFDLAYSIHVLEHIVDPGPHIRNLAALVRDGGYLYIQVPHLMYEVNVVHRCHSAVHCNSFSPRSLVLLLRAHGFTTLRIQADNNIHILARKTGALTAAFTSLPPHRDTADPAEFLDVFRTLAAEQDTPLRFTWDHAYFTITRIRDHQVLFTRPVHFNITPVPQPHALDLTLRGNGDRGPSLPIHFHHASEAPPVYVKLQ
jgi:SAM-dependent methyltransferase